MMIHDSTQIYNYDTLSTNDGDDCGMTQLNGKFFFSFISITLIYLFTLSF